jgi:hypothetical protein
MHSLQTRREMKGLRETFCYMSIESQVLLEWTNNQTVSQTGFRIWDIKKNEQTNPVVSQMVRQIRSQNRLATCRLFFVSLRSRCFCRFADSSCSKTRIRISCVLPADKSRGCQRNHAIKEAKNLTALWVSLMNRPTQWITRTREANKWDAKMVVEVYWMVC